MVLGQTDGYRYLGFQPPLTQEEIDQLPIPIGEENEVDGYRPFVSVENDGSISIGFDSMLFYEPENIPTDEPDRSLFVGYAKQVAERLGNVSLDTTVRYLGPGSMFAPADQRAD